MDDKDRYTRITLRIPKDLHAKLQAASDESSKSMNAEIIERVENSFSAPDPGAALNTISRLELDLSDTAALLDETERLALLMSIALAATYGITKHALEFSPEDTSRAKSILDAGMGAVRTFSSSYSPKGAEGVVKRVGLIASALEPEIYEQIIKAVAVSDETNEMIRLAEERALEIIKRTLDKHNIEEAPPARRFIALAFADEMPRPEDMFEDAVNGPPSDDPVVRAEQEKRGLIPPSDETPKK